MGITHRHYYRSKQHTAQKFQEKVQRVVLSRGQASSCSWDDFFFLLRSSTWDTMRAHSAWIMLEVTPGDDEIQNFLYGNLFLCR